MKIFLCDTGLSGRDSLSKATRQLLAYAVKEMWAMDYEPQLAKRPNGKPYFPNEKGKFLSISHSGTMILVGLSHGNIGVDIEKIRPVRNGLQDRIMSSTEQESFELFEVWTLRESIFKLTEQGSLMNMELKRLNNNIVSPFDNVKCKIFTAPVGYAIAAASYSDDFPDAVEIVDYRAISP